MLLFIILIIPIIQVTTLSFPKANDLSSQLKFMNQVKSRAHYIETVDSNDYIRFPQVIQRLMCRFNEASRKLEAIGNLANKDGTLYYNLGELFNLGNNAPIRKIQHNIERINQLHGDFLNSWSTLDVEKMRTFLPKIVESSTDFIPSLLEDTYRLIAPSANNDNSYGRLIETAKKLPRELCGVSVGLAIYKLHADIVHAELISFVTAVFAYELKSMLKNKRYDLEINRIDIKTRLRLEAYTKVIEIVMGREDLPKRFFNCEHKGRHTRGSTYVDFQGLIQGYLANEEDFATEDTCGYTCETIPQGQFLKREKDSNKWVYNKKCTGSLHNCRYFAGYASACQGAENSGRRYDYLAGEGGTYGRQTCPAVVKTQSWNPAGPAGYHCDYCFCTCFDNHRGSKATRAISYRWSSAIASENKVATGFRIIEKNNLIHLQIYQGKLLPGGAIEKGSEGWVPLDDFEYRDEDDYGAYYVRSTKLVHKVDYQFIRDEDFNKFGFEINGYQSGAVGQVLTGARFFSSDDSRIVIQVAYRSFDFNTGRIDSVKPSVYDPAMHVATTELRLNNPGRPIDHVDNALFLDHTWVRLQASDVESDIAQSTVPYLDAREAVVDFPLSGIGLAYRGTKDGRTGGFLVPTVTMYQPRFSIGTV